MIEYINLSDLFNNSVYFFSRIYLSCLTLICFLLKVDFRLQTLRTTKNECQTFTVTSMGFSKHCYLNPGLFTDTQ